MLRNSNLILRPGLSHLPDHEFKHNFQDKLNQFGDCDSKTETSTHYLLYCLSYENERLILLSKTILLS